MAQINKLNHNTKGGRGDGDSDSGCTTADPYLIKFNI